MSLDWSASRWTVLGLGALGAVALAGFVAAQTPPLAPSIEPPAAVTPPPAPTPPSAPAADEAPPAEVAPQAPVATPPLTAQEVAPAAPPKAQAVEKAQESTVKRERYDVAILQALDKITAETVRFEAQVGQPVRYKTLVFTVKACERSAPDEVQDDSIVYLTVESQPVPVAGRPTPPPRQAFRGWMYASSPGLNPLQHPVYDAWLITCKTAGPERSSRR